MAHFHLDEFAPAIEQWQAGFRLKPDPTFLFNIAQAYRLSKQPEKALTFYRKYLKLSPNASNRAEVERHIANIEQLINRQETSANPAGPAAPPPPSPPSQSPMSASAVSQSTSVSPAPAASESTAARPAPPPWLASPSPSGQTPARIDLTEPTEPASRPFYARAWFWGVVGGVAVASAVAAVLIARSHNSGPRQLPEVAF